MVQDVGIQHALKETDRHLLAEIVLGVLRHQGLLNHILGTFVPSKRFSEMARALLQGAFYQALFLDRIPDYAIVSETMKSADLFRMKTWDKKFLRGVLGNFFRNRWDCKKNLNLPRGARFSHPSWIVELWEKYLPPDLLEACLSAGNIRPPFPIHAVPGNPKALECLHALQEGSLPFQESSENFLLAEKWDARIASALEQGLLYIQGTSQREAIQKCPAKAGENILEIGAAPGGKTIHLSTLVGTQGKVFAIDVNQKRLKLLEARIALLKLKNVQPALQDLFEKFPDTFPDLWDHIVLDAPCSNLGELCRKPEVRWRLHKEDLLRFQELQKRMTFAAWQKLKPGGSLLYITCTLSQEENEDLRDFIAKNLEGKFQNELKTFPLPRTPFGGYACLFRK
jgi:16S rRNA (cytosine967-C5)-methyltransferase